MFTSCVRSRVSQVVLLPFCFAAALWLLTVSSAIPAAAEAAFEIPGTLSASQILPRALLSGPNYRVRDKVAFYGYMHHYIVDSDFGVFEVTGDLALRKLIREIGAIAVLQKIQKSRAYLEGLRNAASKPIEFGVNVITDPVDTLSGIPAGVTSLFENVQTGLTRKSGRNEDRQLAQLLAMSKNKRELARELGVDVYSSNKVLQKELNSVAWATTLGNLTVTAALAPVGGAAAGAVSLSGTAQRMGEMPSDNSPQKLRRMNEDTLHAMSVSTGLIHAFLNNAAYTPTQDTVIVASLKTLTGARGRDAFLQAALSATDEESASFFEHAAEILWGYQTTVSPIKDLAVFGPLVFARAANGTVVIPLPIDRAIWTQSASQRVSGAMRSYRAANPNVKGYQFWLTGTASKLAKERAAKHGIKTVEYVGSRIELMH
ncbi:MAG: hypothetical protein P4L55_09590 [Syntrophobacteraceae bacterium]|nr:hypothetical protein [Syntrophobacteraceae bacterium]